ncbi:glycosyltransferase family 4 protein [Candidatus Sumerlaeota bacterium]|nr:glycosyltransferase family 4 protein [Candidatus Sumerlaeota bacterium]
MRILQITPGTGGFHCGNCIRDNMLVHELRALGHDAVMAPLYLPLITDEAILTDGMPMFFGGVNVYLQQKFSLFRHTPRWIDRVFDAQWLLRGVAKKAGMTEAHELGEMTFSMIRGEHGNQAKELRRMIDWLQAHEQPFDVVNLSNALLIGMARELRERLKIPVLCTLQGEDTFIDALGEPWTRRVWDELSVRAAEADGLVSISEYYAHAMRERLGEAVAEKIRVVHNGVAMHGHEPAAAPPDPPAIGYLARFCEPKGIGMFVDAFIELKRDPAYDHVRMRAAGAMTPADEPLVAELKQKLASNGLLEHAEFLPNVSRDEKMRFLQSISLLSVPALYGEAFGLYVIEALASGAPVVQPKHASFPELIAATDGGWIYGDLTASGLAEAWKQALSDPAELRRRGLAGREAALKKFSSAQMAQGVLETFNAAIEHYRR